MFPWLVGHHSIDLLKLWHPWVSINNSEWLELELVKDKEHHGTVYNLITVLQLQTLQDKVTQGYSSMLARVFDKSLCHTFGAMRTLNDPPWQWCLYRGCLGVPRLFEITIKPLCRTSNLILWFCG